MDGKIYLIRHGLTGSNKKKIYAGWSGDSLSREGVRAVMEIGRKLKEFQIERIFSSPIRRALQTAEIINRFLKVGVEIEINLREMRIGLWEGFSEPEVASEFPEEWKIWNTRPSELKMEGRETLRELLLRTLDGIERISKWSDGSRALAVTHVALIRVLMIYHNGMNINDYRKVDVPNGAVYLLNDNKISRVEL
jgi:alpha-ribazole phosphatase/probable phosphoglycerate mutase